MRPALPIETVPLFNPLHEELMGLLHRLEDRAWSTPTVCRGWSIQDIAAHMLDTQIRRLSQGRDGRRGPSPDSPIAGYGELVTWLNRLNHEWVTALRRASPPVLTDLLAVVGPQYCEYVAGLDPNGIAPFPVAWAGEDSSPNWFDIARDYTEYWHHQQQIREAAGIPLLDGGRWLHPVIAVLLRALPRAFEGAPAERGASVQVLVTGEAGGEWLVVRQDRWVLMEGTALDASATVTMNADTAWRLLTKGIAREVAAARADIAGDHLLGGRVFDAVAIMG